MSIIANLRLIALFRFKYLLPAFQWHLMRNAIKHVKDFHVLSSSRVLRCCKSECGFDSPQKPSEYLFNMMSVNIESEGKLLHFQWRAFLHVVLYRLCKRTHLAHHIFRNALSCPIAERFAHSSGTVRSAFHLVRCYYFQQISPILPLRFRINKSSLV